MTLAPQAPRSASVDLATLRGQVHRFSGVVDRFGSFATRTGTVRTICLRSLRLDSAGISLHPDHWWFRLREVWSEAGVQEGDTVLFTAKVQRCSKGWEDSPGAASRPQPRSGRTARRREQVIGFAAEPRTVQVVPRRVSLNNPRLEALDQELQSMQRNHEQIADDLRRVSHHRDELLEELAVLNQSHRSEKLRSQRLLQRSRRLAALLLGLGAAGGFALGWGGAQLRLQSQPVALTSSAQLPQR
jgi:hypothetical protein